MKNTKYTQLKRISQKQFITELIYIFNCSDAINNPQKLLKYLREKPKKYLLSGKQYSELVNLYYCGFEAVVCNEDGSQFIIDDENWKDLKKVNGKWEIDKEKSNIEFDIISTEVRNHYNMVKWEDDKPTLISTLLYSTVDEIDYKGNPLIV